jgi:hypothetical protein
MRAGGASCRQTAPMADGPRAAALATCDSFTVALRPSKQPDYHSACTTLVRTPAPSARTAHGTRKTNRAPAFQRVADTSPGAQAPLGGRPADLAALGGAGRHRLVPDPALEDAGGRSGCGAWRRAAGRRRRSRRPRRPWRSGRARRRRRGLQHGRHRHRQAGRHSGAARGAGHGHPGGQRDRAAAGLGRAHRGALPGRPDGQEGRRARHHRPAAVPERAGAGRRRTPARRGPTGRGARHAAALPDPARPGLHRPPGRRHPGRAGQAARRHRGHRPRQREHRQAQPDLEPHHRAGQRAHRPAAGGRGQLHLDRHHQRRGDHHADRADRRRVLHSARPRAGGAGAPGAGRQAGRHRLRPHAHAPAGRRHVRHARQPGRHRHRHGEGQGPLHQRRQRAVPEPVRQPAAAAAHRERRGGGAGDGAAPRPQRRLRVRAEHRQHRVAAHGDARRVERGQRGDHVGPGSRRAGGDRRRRPAEGRRAGADRGRPAGGAGVGRRIGCAPWQPGRAR